MVWFALYVLTPKIHPEATLKFSFKFNVTFPETFPILKITLAEPLLAKLKFPLTVVLEPMFTVYTEVEFVNSRLL